MKKTADLATTASLGTAPAVSLRRNPPSYTTTTTAAATTTTAVLLPETILPQSVETSTVPHGQTSVTTGSRKGKRSAGSISSSTVGKASSSVDDAAIASGSQVSTPVPSVSAKRAKNSSKGKAKAVKIASLSTDSLDTPSSHDALPMAELEPRKHKFVVKPSKATLDRIERARFQTLFLIRRTVEDPLSQSFDVLGTTGNVYTVNISEVPFCNCPDFIRGYRCKHSLFVMMRVLRCLETDHRIFQKALTDGELKNLFENAPPPDTNIMASERICQAFQDKTKPNEPRAILRPFEANETCPICYSEMTQEELNTDKLDYCRSQCANRFHTECLQNWRQHCQRTHTNMTCVYCRSPWIELYDDPDRKRASLKNIFYSGAYINLDSC
ncbi:hypothetical protein BASA60_004441 [Batrachochytrium salamandrivorans]|nr:hypothetical protein BASA60_004441 [Batrachochytrium salamandrivorans]KAH9249964.1 hypothetical protein BASA81_012271 [Batrachochytrium salamandrivorans]